MSSRKIVSRLIVSILVLVAMGCAPAMSTPAVEPGMVLYEVEAEKAASEDAYAPAEPGSGAASYATVERLIIRNASLNLVVPDTKAALDEIEDLVDELGGYIVESNVYQYQEGQRASVRLRVPAESLDAALERIRGLATEVRSESVSGQDVTEEYVDLQSGLRHLEATEERLLEFLEEAEDTEAALAVYQQLQEIQAQIEYTKGRIQYLEQSAAMATVSLEIIPDELAQPIQVGGWNLGGACRDAAESLDAALRFLVEDVVIRFGVPAVVMLAVIAAPFVGLFFLVRAIVRRRRAHQGD